MLRYNLHLVMSWFLELPIWLCTKDLTDAKEYSLRPILRFKLWWAYRPF
jgi:hypothetical protein